MKLDTIYCGDNVALCKELPADFVDLTVTSPPYDNLRTYEGFTWDFEALAKELYRVTKPGGVVVWVVGDATINGSETGTSFRQALYFMECGFNLHDTMIMHKKGGGAVGSKYSYWQVFDFAFVLSKGTPKAVNRIADIKNPDAGKKFGFRPKNQKISSREGRANAILPNFSVRPNIWAYVNGQGDHTDHPAPFPEALARDHILSWSNSGDLVLDPFVGSGTTAKMAKEMGRHFIGFDISEKYCQIANKRIAGANVPLFNLV